MNNGDYMNSSLPASKRAELLLQQMTLEEKVGQMVQYTGIDHAMSGKGKKLTELLRDGDSQAVYDNESVETIIQKVRNGEIGSFLHVQSSEEANFLQNAARESRLRIPLILGIDAIHGHGFFPPGATIFPSPIGLSCSFDTTLVREISEVTAKEMRATGFQWNFSPMIEVARDARWGRIGETFGEDPWLCALFGVAMITGYQGHDPGKTLHVAACAKHFTAGAEPVNALNFAPMDVSERTLREVWFPPYEAAVKAHVATFMTAHNEINGVPCHANTWLVRDILKGEWGFDGFVVSDWKDISRLHTLHKVARNVKEADKMAIEAGVDMHMHGPGFFEEVVELVKEGEMHEKHVNEAVMKILTVKFKLGLFEENIIEISKIPEKVLTREHKEMAYEAAVNSIVLLKNEDNILPLINKTKKIFVTGPLANNQKLLGDWVKPQDPDNVITILEGIQTTFKQSDVNYFDCGEFGEITDENVKKAGTLARNSDVAIVVVGENSFRESEQIKTCGENRARSEINLFGKQLDLIKSIKSAGIPVVVVLINGRPLAVNWCKHNAEAIIEAWEPGMMGGKAVADIIAGKHNPSAKLTISFPLSAGHIPVYYNHKPSMYFRQYQTTPTHNLYDFGFGLSYTTFEYKNLNLKDAVLHKNDVLNFYIEVKNTGRYEGTEIVLAFVNDKISSVTTPVKELKAFRKILLQPGQSEKVEMSIPVIELAMWDKNFIKRVEPGEFELMVGTEVCSFSVKD